ncbi:hypothetical protein B0H67DRAFT_551806 [Lasiosphaeris hirsuta]|uniref:Uncharacterized protein n=1 Tax=Lasiosphaeris hirsuta TaxID=260670 RepID=A0AA40DWZ0_9PEZI|nr:hypothetical protein B0H67DRAFT_551806 [Lasiosphaeris hirsuta]
MDKDGFALIASFAEADYRGHNGDPAKVWRRSTDPSPTRPSRKPPKALEVGVGVGVGVGAEMLGVACFFLLAPIPARTDWTYAVARIPTRPKPAFTQQVRELFPLVSSLKPQQPTEVTAFNTTTPADQSVSRFGYSRRLNQKASKLHVITKADAGQQQGRTGWLRFLFATASAGSFMSRHTLQRCDPGTSLCFDALDAKWW